MQKQRIFAFDNQKFFLIFLVVWGHILESFCSFELSSTKTIFMAIYFFHMPAFVFLSGLMKKRDAKINWNTVLSFFVLGVCYKIMNTVVIGLGTGKWTFHVLDEDGIPWFMFAMAVWPVMAYVVRNIKPVLAMVLGIAVGCMVGFDKDLTENSALLCRILVYFPFYMLGCYLNAEKVLQFCKKRLVKASAMLLAAGYVYAMISQIDVIYKIRHIVTGKNMYSEWAMAHGHMFLRVFCYVGAMIMIFVLISLMPNRKIPVVTVCGARTLSVYMWHRNLIRILVYSGAGAALFNMTGTGAVQTAVVSLVMTLLLSIKIFTLPVDYVMKGMFIKKKE